MFIPKRLIYKERQPEGPGGDPEKMSPEELLEQLQIDVDESDAKRSKRKKKKFAIRPGEDVPEPQAAPVSPKGPGKSPDTGVEKSKETHIDPAKKAEIEKRFSEVIQREYFKNFNVEWNRYETHFRQMIIQHARYYYYMALVNNWSVESTERALQEEARKWRDEMTGESWLSELGHMAKDVWGATPLGKKPNVLPGENPHFKLKIDTQRIVRLEAGLTQAKNWFANEYVLQKRENGFIKRWKWFRETRSVEEFIGSEDRHIEIPMPPFVDNIFIPKPWADKTPFEIMNERVLPFQAKLLALKGAIPQKAFPTQTALAFLTPSQIATDFFDILKTHFKKTLKDEHHDDFEEWMQEEKNTIIGDIEKFIRT